MKIERISGIGIYVCFWLILMSGALPGRGQAQPVSRDQNLKPTVNKRQPVAESDTRETIIQKCGRVEPDASYFIPELFSGRVEASGSGAYAYKPKKECPYWVVDYSMNRFSNTWVNESGLRVREGVLFSGNPYDLPSSNLTNDLSFGRRPNTEEDCKRVEIDVLTYKKDPNENIFRFLKSEKSRFYAWSTSCGLLGLSDFGTIAPTSALLWIRIAVRVKLRGSWQQAAAYAQLAPPN